VPTKRGCRRGLIAGSQRDLVVRPQARLGRDCNMLVAGESELRPQVMGNLVVAVHGEACR
jgi:hypothetical protein